ncbi:MAG: peptide chain release factor N(5)-glutamine methyltransferase [Saprospiraceae bacterium]|nr:peptide chain release factor N(5)-glutamine methyltransferase [Saprospiraceae bacterium]
MIKTYYQKLYDTLLENGQNNREAATITKYLWEDLSFPDTNSDILPGKDFISGIEEVLEKVRNHIPWQYISRKVNFYGRDFYVDERVLIPRPETEELVYYVLQRGKGNNIKTVMDVGTGSGAIALTLGFENPAWQITGIDLSAEALEVAIKNRDTFRCNNVHFLSLDFLDEEAVSMLPDFDLIVSNPPYIDLNEKDHMSTSTLLHEPDIALFVNHHAMEFYEALARFVATRNGPCIVLAEINALRGKETQTVFEKNGLQNVEIIKDMQGMDRIIFAEKSGRKQDID